MNKTEKMSISIIVIKQDSDAAIEITQYQIWGFTTIARVRVWLRPVWSNAYTSVEIQVDGVESGHVSIGKHLIT